MTLRTRCNGMAFAPHGLSECVARDWVFGGRRTRIDHIAMVVALRECFARAVLDDVYEGTVSDTSCTRNTVPHSRLLRLSVLLSIIFQSNRTCIDYALVPFFKPFLITITQVKERFNNLQVTVFW